MSDACQCPACNRPVPNTPDEIAAWVVWFLQYARDTHKGWADLFVSENRDASPAEQPMTGDVRHNQRAVDDYDRVLRYLVEQPGRCPHTPSAARRYPCLHP